MAFDKILLVDDSLIIRKTLETHLRKKQFSVATASSLSEAERLLGRCIFDLVFIEIANYRMGTALSCWNGLRLI